MIWDPMTPMWRHCNKNFETQTPELYGNRHCCIGEQIALKPNGRYYGNLIGLFRSWALGIAGGEDYILAGGMVPYLTRPLTDRLQFTSRDISTRFALCCCWFCWGFLFCLMFLLLLLFWLFLVCFRWSFFDLVLVDFAHILAVYVIFTGANIRLPLSQRSNLVKYGQIFHINP